MATPAGLEPATIRLEGGCSIQLSYGALARNYAIAEPLPSRNVDAVETYSAACCAGVGCPVIEAR